MCTKRLLCWRWFCNEGKGDTVESSGTFLAKPSRGCVFTSVFSADNKWTCVDRKRSMHVALNMCFCHQFAQVDGACTCMLLNGCVYFYIWFVRILYVYIYVYAYIMVMCMNIFLRGLVHNSILFPSWGRVVGGSRSIIEGLGCCRWLPSSIWNKQYCLIHRLHWMFLFQNDWIVFSWEPKWARESEVHFEGGEKPFWIQTPSFLFLLPPGDVREWMNGPPQCFIGCQKRKLESNSPVTQAIAWSGVLRCQRFGDVPHQGGGEVRATSAQPPAVFCPLLGWTNSMGRWMNWHFIPSSASHQPWGV